MNDQVLEQVAKMLRAQLKGAGHLWWIGGYVYGVTGSGDPFVILYPADEKLNEKVVRVYPHDFKKLPAFIPTEGLDAGDTEANPNKEQAKKKGIYHECPIFEIVTFDGKETQMGRERRFGDVLRLGRKAAEAVAEAQRQQRPVQPQQIAPQQRMVSQPQQNSAPQQRPPESPAGAAILPDYRQMAIDATAANEFDYAAYMTLRNGVYDSVERIAKTRGNLVTNWLPAPKTNTALLRALEVYRDKRSAAEADGEAPPAAHAVAKGEAVGAYKALLQE